jgi:flagellar hook assembly protein FlgD
VNDTKTGLSLTPGTRYYFSVKAENGVALHGPVTSSNGQVSSGTTSSKSIRPVIPYPSPYRKSSSSPMKFKLNTTGDAQLKIYTISGKLIKKITADSGTNEVDWDCKNSIGGELAAGMYLYLITDYLGNNTSGKIVIMR